MNAFYEVHHHEDPRFPIIYHDITVEKNQTISGIHWHGAPEILMVKSGEVQVLSDAEVIGGRAGDIIVINPNEMHLVRGASEQARYYCLIIDRAFVETAAFAPDKVVFKKVPG